MIALIVEKYLQDKRHLQTDNDSICLDGNSIIKWDFANIPAPSQEELDTLSVIVEAEQQAQSSLQAKITAGAAARKACEQVLDLIAGYNLERELSMAQITQMQQTFEMAEKALRAGRPTLAKQAIQMIEPDGVLVTEEMKEQALTLLIAY